eukprot:21109_1
MQTAKPNLDIYLSNSKKCFKDDIDDEQKISIQDCSAINRLLLALKYYMTLNITDKTLSHDELCAFCSDIYQNNNMLDDYAHILSTHKHEMQIINKILMESDVYQMCKWSKCNLLRRHYNDNRRQTISNNMNQFQYDAYFLFLRDLFDNIHVYFFHLFDMGLRVSTQDLAILCKHEFHWKMDSMFARQKTIILNKKKNLNLKIKRFDNKENTKFNIQIKSTNNKLKNCTDSEETFIDAFADNMTQKIGVLKTKKLMRFIIEENYDTDSVYNDIELRTDIKKSNICKHHQQFADSIKTFVQSTQLSSASFSLGIRWYYWDGTGNMKLNNKTEMIWNATPFGGCKKCDLYVKAKYNDYKIELLEHIPIQQYNDLVVLKAEKYISCETSKSMKSNFYSKQYGMKRNECITLNHLSAVIMYCDFTVYCTKFSSTFRKIKPFEDLDSIRSRNESYFWQSKLLREAVECFGTTAVWNKDKQIYEYIHGPFFCGMSFVMNMPEMMVSLNGPTSTSQNMEVSINFAKRDGIIIELNNNGNSCGSDIPIFDCSFISSYGEESECLFFGSKQRIRIVSVRIVKDCLNYGEHCKALYIFDSMLNNIKDLTLKITKKDVSCMEAFIALQMENTHKYNKYTDVVDDYLLSTFSLFVQSKKQINVKMQDLVDKYSSLYHLIIESDIKCTSGSIIESDVCETRSNLLSFSFLKMMKNVEQITIKTTFSDGGETYNIYMFNLEYFLEIINALSSWKEIQVTVEKQKRYKTDDSEEEQLKYHHKYKQDYFKRKYRFMESWLHHVWNRSQETQVKFNKNRIKTELKSKNNWDKLIIQRDNHHIFE